MREAFTYMFKDNCYYKKALIYLVLNFIANSLIAYAQMNSFTGVCPINSKPEVLPNELLGTTILSFTGFLVNMFVLGYFLNCVEAIVHLACK